MKFLTASLILLASCRTQEIIFPERPGAIIAETLTSLYGSDTDAVTFGGRTYYFRDSQDPCLREHERVHREDQRREGLMFYQRYKAELVACMLKIHDLGKCYWQNSYEVRARVAQDVCLAQ